VTSLAGLFEPRRDIPALPRILAGSFTFAFLLVLWSAASYGGYIGPLFLPSPSAVVYAIWGLLRSYELFTHVGISCYRITFGFAIAATLAVPLGVLMGSFAVVRATIEPMNDFIRYMPVAAFIPLTILWADVGDLEKIAIIFIGTFFQLVLLVADNAKVVPTEYLEVAYTLGGSKSASVRKVLLPAALPGILDSLRIAIGWAWSYLIVAEIVAANRGLGFLIIQSQRFLHTAQIVAGIIVIGLIGLGTDYLFRLLSRRLFPWRDESRR